MSNDFKCLISKVALLANASKAVNSVIGFLRVYEISFRQRIIYNIDLIP